MVRLIWINENISFYSKKKAATSEHCVFNIIIIFQFIIIGNGQCSKNVIFYRTEAGLTSKRGRISPAVQWCYQNQSNCTTWRRTARRPARLKTLIFFFFNPSPSSCRAVLKEWQIWKLSRGQPRGQLSVHMYCVYTDWLLLRDQLSSSVHNLYRLAPGLCPVYTICTV